ncbi:MAG: TIGR02996 domain-containing protein [Myxococcota bacterium]
MEQLFDELTANPHDDTLWQVFADWLWSQGDPRAEAVQLGLQLVDAPPSAERDEWVARYRTFCDLGALKNATHLRHVRWRMGFVDSVTLDLSSSQGAQAFEALSEHPAARLLVELRIIGATQERLRPILAMPCLRRLKVLELASEGRATLDSAVALPSLVELFMSTYPLEAPGIEALAQWQLPHLSRLDLGGMPLDAMATQALGRAPFLGQLRDLHLARCHIGDEGFAAMFGVPRPALRRLDLEGNRLTAPSLEGFLRDVPPRLSHLDVSANPLRSGLMRMGRMALPWLRRLDVRNTGVDGSVLDSLGRSTGLPRLSELDIRGNRVPTAIVEAFQQTPVGRQLGYLGWYAPRG